MCIHVVTLNNGKRVFLEEGESCLHVGEWVCGPSTYICTIGNSGVLSMPNSGDGPESISSDLNRKDSTVVVDYGKLKADQASRQDLDDLARIATRILARSGK